MNVECSIQNQLSQLRCIIRGTNQKNLEH